MHKGTKHYLKKAIRLLDKPNPIFLTAIILLGNLINLALVLRAHPFLVGLGEYKSLFVGLLKIANPLVNFLYLLLVIFLTRTLTRNVVSKALLLLILLISAILTSVYLYLGFLEASHYPNYIFSTFSVYLPSLRVYTIFHFFLILIGIGSYNYFLNKKSVVFFAPHLLCLLVIFNNLLMLPNLIISEVDVLRRYLFLQKTNEGELIEFKDLHSNLSFIKDNTEENSVIIHPQQSEAFPVLGNQPLIRYVLFPRILVTQNLVDKFWKEHSDFSGHVYSMVSVSLEKGKPIYFPQEAFAVKDFKIMDSNGEAMSLSSGMYSPEYMRSLEEFKIGLVRLR